MSSFIENVQTTHCFGYTLELHDEEESPHQDEARELCDGASVAFGALDGGTFISSTYTWRG